MCVCGQVMQSSVVTIWRWAIKHEATLDGRLITRARHQSARSPAVCLLCHWLQAFASSLALSLDRSLVRSTNRSRPTSPHATETRPTADDPYPRRGQQHWSGGHWLLLLLSSCARRGQALIVSSARPYCTARGGWVWPPMSAHSQQSSS